MGKKFKHSRYATIKTSEKEWIKTLAERIEKDEIIYDIKKLKLILQIIVNRHRSRENQRKKNSSIENHQKVKEWKELKTKLRAINF